MRFTKDMADAAIERYNDLKGFDGKEPGSLFRYTHSGRTTLQRVSKGNGRSEVSYGIMTSKDVVMVVNALIDQHYFETPFQELMR